MDSLGLVLTLISLLYGGSMLLGHEMVHGFDDRGRTYDKDGLKFNWWKPSEVTEYNKRTQCLVSFLL